MRVLRPVFNIFYAVTKRTTNRSNKKVDGILRERAVEALKPDFAYQNMLNSAFSDRQKCGIQFLIIEIR